VWKVLTTIETETDGHTIVGDNCGAVSRNFEFVGSELQNGSEGRSLGNVEHFERQLWVTG
jgi:hypothetical protein